MPGQTNIAALVSEMNSSTPPTPCIGSLEKQSLWKRELGISADATVWKNSAPLSRTCKNLKGSRDESKSGPPAIKLGEIFRKMIERTSSNKFYNFNPFRYSRKGSPRSSLFRANSTVAFRKPSLSPVS